MQDTFSLEKHGITVQQIIRNPSPAALYELGLRNEAGTAITDTGALVALSGEKTGRSPKDKRIVDSEGSHDEVWWGSVNIEMDEQTFNINRERAIDYLNTREFLYCIDAFAGWDPKHRIKVRIVCARAYHALFMHNMLIRPQPRRSSRSFGEPDYVIFNAGPFPARTATPRGMTSKTSVSLHNLTSQGVRDPGYGVRRRDEEGRLHGHELPDAEGRVCCRCTARRPRDRRREATHRSSSGSRARARRRCRRIRTATTDRRRRALLESDNGIFNIEGGCYAKAIDLGR